LALEDGLVQVLVGDEMKKQIIIIGIISTLVCISFSGCTQTNNNKSLTNDDNQIPNINYPTVSELKLHPNRYLGNAITLKAIFERLEYYPDMTHTISYYVISDAEVGMFDDNKGNNIGLEIPDEVNSSLLMLGETYYFTGVLGYGNYTGIDNYYTSLKETQLAGLFFRVSSVDLYYVSESNTPTLYDIGSHPPSYLFKIITTKGRISSDLSKIEYDNINGLRPYTIKINKQNMDASILIPGGEYYFTGIVHLDIRFGRVPHYRNTNWWNTPMDNDGYIVGTSFVVSEIEPT
jgi:hypothetical protein